MQLTIMLQALETGDRKALDQIIPLVYDDLKKLARAQLRREQRADVMETTVLVHEAFLKFTGARHPFYGSRSHFFGVASRLMRQILVDTARFRNAAKRDVRKNVDLDELDDFGNTPDRSLLAMNSALEELEKWDPLKARIIEMRYFGGMTAEESSVALSKPVHIVRRELRLAQAWLRREMEGPRPGASLCFSPAS
jgi:RNA polymerase sigma factor (TIGR02999 family)